MDRLVLLVFAFVAQVGCQAPGAGFSPFGAQQTRVPPPPTGVIGDGGNYYSPSPNSGAYIPPQQHPGEQITNVGPWRYWESADTASRNNSLSRSTQMSPSSASDRQARTRGTSRSTPSPAAPYTASPSGLTKNDRLAWQHPFANSAPTYSEFIEHDAPVAVARSPVGSGYAPRYLPQTGPTRPLVSAPVRVRGFTGTPARQSVAITPELAQFQYNGVRQANATSSNWQTRYDDIRR